MLVIATIVSQPPGTHARVGSQLQDENQNYQLSSLGLDEWLIKDITVECLRCEKMCLRQRMSAQYETELRCAGRAMRSRAVRISEWLNKGISVLSVLWDIVVQKRHERVVLSFGPAICLRRVCRAGQMCISMKSVYCCQKFAKKPKTFISYLIF